jgi:hypothetical protein
VRRLFSRRKLPSWAVILYLVITEVPDWRGRLEFWLDAAQQVNPYLAIAATVAGSAYFRWGLFAAALAYLSLVGEPSRGVQHHHWWPHVAWSILIVCFTAIVITAGVGYFEYRLKIAIYQSPLIVTQSQRQVSDARIDCFRRKLPGLGNTKVSIGAVNGDRESMHYAG